MSKSNKKTLIKKPNKSEIGVKISNLLEYGRKEITKKSQLEKYAIGSLISYMTKNNEFRPAGFITKLADDHFTYITPDFKTKYRVRYENVKKMWVGDVYQVTNDLVSFAGATQKKTKYPITIGDVDVYYGKASYYVKRFKNTDKYKRMMNWYNYFVDN